MKSYIKTEENQITQKSKQLEAIAELKLYIPDLPEDLVINGNLNLAEKWIKMLPDNLTVNGNLDLTNCCNLDELPFNLTVNGNLTMDSSISGISLRPCTKIKGNFSKCWHYNIPENFTIGGDLIVVDYLKSLPTGLTVMGSLDLSETKITELPPRLKVMGNLDISGLPITELPKDLYVGGHLCATNTGLKSFPETIVANGGFSIAGTKIKVFPRQFRHVIGDVHLDNTAIRSLPDGLTVVGCLGICNTQIAELPENLHVYGPLYCAETYIESIPESLRIEDSLHLDGCPIEKLPDNLMIKGSMNIDDTIISEIPAGLIVNGDFEFSDTLIKELPQFMNIGGLHINNTKMKRLPDNFTVTGNLSIWYCKDEEVHLTELPKGLKVGGSLRLPDNLYSRLPEDLFVGGDLDISNQDNLKTLPKNFTVKGKLKLGRQYDIIRGFLMGIYSIEGIVEMSFDNYRMGSVGIMYKKDDIYNRLTREGDVATLAPAPQRSC